MHVKRRHGTAHYATTTRARSPPWIVDFTPEDVAFRDEVRTWLENDYPAELRGKYSRDEYSQGRFPPLAAHALQARLGRARPGRRSTAAPAGRRRRRYIFQEECARAETLPIPPFGVSMLAPVISGVRHARSRRSTSCRASSTARLLVPGLFRAGRRLRPRLAEDQGRARRRPLHRQRPEDLDHARPVRRLGLLPRAAPTRTRRSRRKASPSCSST